LLNTYAVFTFLLLVQKKSNKRKRQNEKCFPAQGLRAPRFSFIPSRMDFCFIFFKVPLLALIPNFITQKYIDSARVRWLVQQQCGRFWPVA
jgi:hypothetical protein